MIELSGIVKAYRLPWRRGATTVHALDGIDLRVEPGSSVGVVGLNGAGKSTLLRLLLGYVRPTAGEVQIDGLAPRKFVERNGVAYVPERVSIPRHWTVRHALRAYAMMAGSGDDAWDAVEAALERLGLSGLAGRKIGTLSKGNVQRLGIAQALIGDRSIMVLDEPTDGLDPVWIAELREIVGEWRRTRASRILILASHNLPEVERLTERAILLHNGRIEGELRAGESAALEDRFLERVHALGEARA